MTEFAKPGRPIEQALVRPHQRRRRITARRRPHQALEIAEQRWVRDDQRLASAALPANPIGPASGSASPRSSASPQSIVLRAMPVICATAVTPPRPAASASAAANRRRPRSSNNGSSASYRNLIAASSVILRLYILRVVRGIPSRQEPDSLNYQRALTVTGQWRTLGSQLFRLYRDRELLLVTGVRRTCLSGATREDQRSSG